MRPAAARAMSLKGGFWRAPEIGPHQKPEGFRRILALAGTEEAEPFGADRHMLLLVLVDHVENRGAVLVARLAHLCPQGGRHIEASGFQNERHHGEPRGQIIAGVVGCLPQSVMGGDVAVIRTQRTKTFTHQVEMLGFFEGDLHPAIEEALRHGGRGEAGDDIQRQIGGVEFDMGDGVQERDPPVRRMQRTALDLRGRDKLGPCRAAGPERRQRVERRAQRQTPRMPAGGDILGKRGLDVEVFGENGPRRAIAQGKNRLVTAHQPDLTALSQRRARPLRGPEPSPCARPSRSCRPCR